MYSKNSTSSDIPVVPHSSVLTGTENSSIVTPLPLKLNQKDLFVVASVVNLCA